jgi:competence protein ComEC
MPEVKNDYKIIFFDVGQEDATLIQKIPENNAVLIDAKDAGPVCDYLRNKGNLEAIFITHWDSDHINGIPNILTWLSDNHNQQNIASVFINPPPPVDTKIAKRLKLKLHEAYEENIIQFGSVFNEGKSIKTIEQIGGIFYIIWPDYKQIIVHHDKNVGSLILRFEVGLCNLLLGGDVDGSVWPGIEKIDRKLLKADILKYPHHGGKLKKNENDWSGTDLIENVKPEWVVVSVGKNNQYNHPSNEFESAKQKFPEIKFLSTQDGTIDMQLESSKGKIYYQGKKI